MWCPTLIAPIPGQVKRKNRVKRGCFSRNPHPEPAVSLVERTVAESVGAQSVGAQSVGAQSVG